MTAKFYKGGLRIKEQHEIVIDVFRIPKLEPFLDGNHKMFTIKAMVLLVFLMAMKFIFGVFFPGIFHIVLMLIAIPLFVLMIIKIVEKSNQEVNQSSFALVKYFFVILAIMAVSGVSYVIFP
jgi:hypothetical protein